MGVGKGGGQQVTDYLMSVHMGVCATVDAITGIYVDQKPLWEGEITAETDLSINLPKLFGGPKQQGGCVGNIHCFFGGTTQVIPDVIAEYFGATSATCPGYRGMLSLFFSGNNVVSGETLSAAVAALKSEGVSSSHANAKSFMWTSNNPVIAQNLDIKVRRIPTSLNASNGRIGALIDTDFLVGNSSDIPTLAANTALSINANSRFFTARVTGSNQIVIDTIRNDSAWLTSVNAQNPETGKQALTITSMTMQGGNYTCTLTIANMPVLSGMTFTIGEEIYTFYEGGDDANGAHIIYDCLTNDDWGLGYPPALIDQVSFNTAAATLFAESLGLSVIWTQQSKIEDFINEILNHIQGVFYVSPVTGLMTLDLIRDDYDPTTLPVFTPDNANMTSFQQRDWADTVNEIVVTWTNPLTEQGETVSVQDLGNIAIQGQIVSDSRNYYGVRNSALALKLAARELRSASAPLATLELEIDRSAWTLTPGKCVIVNWPENNISAMVCRVGKVDYGKIDDPKITVPLVQDIFSLDHPPIQLAQVTAWIDQAAAAPADLPAVQIFTLPYFMASSAFLQSRGIALSYPEVLASVFGYTSDRTVHDLFLYGETADATGATSWNSLGTLTVTEEAPLGVALNAEAVSGLSCSVFADSDRAPAVGDFMLIGGADAAQEFVLVTATDGANYTVNRGVLDTVPQAWPVGTPVWAACQGLLTVDEKNIRSSGETVTYALLPRGAGGTLPFASASQHSLQLTARPYLPLRPANVQVNGVGFGGVAVGTSTTLKVTWATRNRTLEDTQALAWTDGAVTPEYLQQTIVTVTDVSTGDVIYQQGSLWTETELDLPVAWFNRYTSIKITVSSSMNGVASLQSYSLVVTGLPGDSNAGGPPAPPAATSAPSPITAPGANIFTVSGSSITGPDGDAHPALTISGTPDTDAANTSLIVQFRKTGTQAWTTAAPLSLYGSAVSMVISGVAGATEYDVQVAYEQPYDNAYVTSAWVAAVGSPVTTGSAGSPAETLDGPNRVLFSQFEKGTYGWQAVTGEETTTSPLHTVPGADSLTYGAMSGTGNGATDGGIYIAIQQADLVPVTPNETLFVGGKTMFSGACTGQIVVQWFDSTQKPIGQVNQATGVIPGDGVTRVQGGFVTAPATAAFASLEFGANGTSGTTQTFGLQFTQAMLCSASPGQTTWPSFTAGPAAVPGADVTGSFPLPGVNRLALSQFEKGTASVGPTSAWTLGDGGGLSTPTFSTLVNGALTYGELSGSGTAGAWAYIIQRIPVQGGETLCFSANVYVSGPAKANMGVDWYDGSGNYMNTGAMPISGVTSTVPILEQAWCTVPAGAAFGNVWLETAGYGGGTSASYWANVMVCGVIPGQTAFPTFSPGNNSVPGADVTSSNTAGGIAGQGPWATANVTYSTSAPTSPRAGDIWVNTSKTPNVWQSWSGSTWVATTPTDTKQLTDGANLGQTADWGSVASRPANIAKLSGSEVIDNSKVQTGGVNRIAFSLFEKWSYEGNGGPPVGWQTVWNGYPSSQGLPWYTLHSEWGNIPCLVAQMTATAAGQGFSVGEQDPFIGAPNYTFPVVPGEWLYVGAQLGTWNSTAMPFLVLSDVTHKYGANFWENSPGSISGAYPIHVGYFVQIPQSITDSSGNTFTPAYGTFNVLSTSQAAGGVGCCIGQPMVCGVQAGQATFPNFAAGPNAVPGADVTGDNQASSFAGQGALATLGSVGTGYIDQNAVTAGAASSQGWGGMISGQNNTLASVGLTTTGNNVLVTGVMYLILGYSSSETVTCSLSDETGPLMDVQFSSYQGTGIYAFPFQYGGPMAAGAHTFSLLCNPGSTFTTAIHNESSIYAVELKR